MLHWLSVKVIPQNTLLKLLIMYLCSLALVSHYTCQSTSSLHR